ncbi:ornithine aminotransferase [Virgisporangium aliadipatigenens]|uniref:Ornithine aminotransferase n=1 Tax=Virgisporangium aliadipatigenens TaxID=741659 RepID=A0A8J4DUY0_9ACTN|nr:BON domain-containing protein [Virgisporangium aliadipatigenens]GIJ50563.1 ornithine aminotransferase [Virgisporangium aliadipatigenens]
MTSATTTLTDEQIQREVLAELKWDSRLQPNEIGVAVKDGVVTLTGTVDSFIKKWAAENATQRVRGVQAVANDIEVRLTGDDRRTDPDIAAAAARALESDSLVPNGAVKVTVSKGWVTLRGTVEWEYQRRAAERTVRTLPGVVGISNLVTVRPRSTPSDLKRKIEDALTRSAATSARSIDVTIEGDRVILDGTVRSWAEKQEAERVAWSAPGITEVQNRIVVRP